jgi:hypothetical protein
VSATPTVDIAKLVEAGIEEARKAVEAEKFYIEFKNLAEGISKILVCPSLVEINKGSQLIPMFVDELQVLKILLREI